MDGYGGERTEQGGNHGKNREAIPDNHGNSFPHSKCDSFFCIIWIAENSSSLSHEKLRVSASFMCMWLLLCAYVSNGEEEGWEKELDESSLNCVFILQIWVSGSPSTCDCCVYVYKSEKELHESCKSSCYFITI